MIRVDAIVSKAAEKVPGVSMISALVLAADLAAGDDAPDIREVAVRSLGWLVSAVVAGTVRDVTLAAPAALGLGDIADQAGCALVQADTEAERLAVAIESARGPLLLVIKSGFHPQSGLIEEVAHLVRHETEVRALILSTPTTFVERLLPDRAAVVGFLAPIALCRGHGRRGFRPLTRSLGGATPLRHRASAIS